MESGHPWNPETGRETMICLPGLCLATEKVETAKAILRDYAGYMHQGLIPNRILDGGKKLDYASADTTLWFANAIYETLLAEWDQDFAKEAFKWLSKIVEWHIKGTLHGIHVDPRDGLLSQGENGVQLTWMRMKVGGFPATPRHGKPVDVNGLWINLLGITDWIGTQLKKPVADFVDAWTLAMDSFETKFWNPKLGYYLDTVDPDDASFRPNQLIAMSLPFGPGGNGHAAKVLDKIESELLTPFGLRTLDESDPHYIPRYEGTVADCDRALHQGSVIPWLLGPYVATIMRFTIDRKRAERALETVVQKLESYGLDGIAEVYDGSAPHRAAGCPWQATSLAEILRAWRAVQ
ncbi:MAG: amylo-alpha-1,6-glucosidase [Fimbriimonadaceae bacterium]